MASETIEACQLIFPTLCSSPVPPCGIHQRVVARLQKFKVLLFQLAFQSGAQVQWVRSLENGELLNKWLAAARVQPMLRIAEIYLALISSNRCMVGRVCAGRSAFLWDKCIQLEDYGNHIHGNGPQTPTPSREFWELCLALRTASTSQAGNVRIMKLLCGIKLADVFAGLGPVKVAGLTGPISNSNKSRVAPCTQTLYTNLEKHTRKKNIRELTQPSLPWYGLHEASQSVRCQ